MILINAIPRLEEAIKNSNSSDIPTGVSFLYNELLTHDTISSVFDWLFRKNVDFSTKHEEFRFIIIIHPDNTKVQPFLQHFEKLN